MKKKHILMLTLYLATICAHCPVYSLEKAIISVAVADLLGNPIKQVRPNEHAEHAYKTLPMCAVHTDSSSTCPRLHQLLYNDIVHIIKTEQEEVCIETTHAFYLTPSSPAPQTHYWTLKKNICQLADITANNMDINHIPEPIDFTDQHHTALKSCDVVVLKEPHYDKKLKMDFSAGTRFVRIPCKTNKKNSNIPVFAIDYGKIQEHKIQIPHKKCIIIDTGKKNDERIADYVATLKKWAHTKQGCIPYVWGGTSFAHTTSSSFKEVIQRTNNSDYSCYQYEKDNRSPKSGFDCSGLIVRAAQINGIPYFCKNTTTISHCLTPLQKEQKLTAGDLIVIRGHVMAISDVEKNLLIEARSYGHGYGKLHEIPISCVFDGIQTYNDLLDAYHNKKVVKRKDKRGNIRDTFANIQIFSMTSVWDKKVINH